MASYTGNLGLKKPALDDDALITDINNNMDIVDAAINGIQDGLAIVANNNTHVAITAGQFVYVRNHSTLTEGLYVASTNIAANATLSSSNLTADTAGGLNSLNSKITPERMTLFSGSNKKILIETCGNVVHYYSTSYVTNSDLSSITFPNDYKPDYDVYASIQYYKSGDGYLVRQGVLKTTGIIEVFDTNGNNDASYTAIAFSFTYVKE